MRRGRRRPVLEHSLGKDDEFHVADNGHAAECDGGGPERCMVGDTAGDGGKMRMCRGEQVEGYVRGEDFGGKRRGEEGWEAGLEGADC